MRVTALLGTALLGTSLLVGLAGIATPVQADHAATPSAALAADGTLTVHGTVGGDTLRMQCQQGVPGLAWQQGWVPVAGSCASVRRVVVHPGQGSDEIQHWMDYPDFPEMEGTEVDADDAVRDHVEGSHWTDQLTGDRRDTVVGFAGNDRIFGGATVDGGFGDDFLKVEYSAAADHAEWVPLAAGSVDGAQGNDVWAAMIRDVPASAWAVLDGAGLTVGATTMPVRGIETAALWFPSAARFDGLGFPGDLVVTGSEEPDNLTGGPGTDDIEGLAGDDWIRVRDGRADLVDCGAGNDTVEADPLDDLRGCEVVQLPAQEPAPAPQPPPQPAPAPAPAPAPVTPPGAAPAPPVTPAGAVLETGRVKGRKAVERGAWARFRFSTPTPGASFECRVDKRSWNACVSPYRVATKRLKRGTHVFRVRAVRDGVRDASPSRRGFRVTRRRG